MKSNFIFGRSKNKAMMQREINADISENGTGFFSKNV
jgi:hypothetical protein